jgi:hypothetical protein
MPLPTLNANADNNNNDDDDGQQLPPCGRTKHEVAGAVFVFYLSFTSVLAPSQAPACEGFSSLLELYLLYILMLV